MQQVQELFDIKNGHSLELNKLTLSTRKDGVAYVSRKSGENGIAAYVEQILGLEPAPAGELTCALSGEGGVMSTFIQEKPYYTSYHVARLTPKIKMSKSELLYYCLCLSKNKYRFSHGRQANRTLKSLMVPSISEIPKWVKLSNTDLYSGAERPASKSKPKPKPKLPVISKTTKFDNIFEIKNGLASSKVKIHDVASSEFVRYLRPSSTMKRTVAGYVDPKNIDKKYIFPKDTIYVSTDGEGSHSYSYVSTNIFVPNSNVAALIPKKPLSIELKLFYALCITKNRYLFSYGRKPKGKRLSSIYLPDLTEKEEKEVEIFVRICNFSSNIGD
jgi:hypothetical protein